MDELETLGYLIGLHMSLGDSHRSYVESSIVAFEYGCFKEGKQLLLKADACVNARTTVSDMVEDLYDLEL